MQHTKLVVTAFVSSIVSFAGCSKRVTKVTTTKSEPVTARASAYERPSTARTRQAVNAAMAPGGVNIDTLKYVLVDQRRTVFEKSMKLSQKDSDGFWDIYDDYEAERAKLDANALKMVSTYSKEYASMTKEQALAFFRALSSSQQQAIALRQKYAEVIATKISELVAARFYQIDDYISTAGRLDALDSLPLIQTLPSN